MSKAKRLESQGPSWTEVILGAVLSIVLGVALSAVFLILKPVAKVKELPKEPVAGAVYFLEGSADTSKAKQAMAKQTQFAQGRTVTFTEDELNSLMAPAAPTAPAKGKPAAEPAPEPAATGALSFGPPNFRIRNGEMQIAVPVRLSVSGLDFNVVAQARGNFSRVGDSYAFLPTDFYIGSCPIHRLAAAESLVMRKALDSKTLPEGVVAAWGKLAGVAVSGSTLHLTMP